MRVLGLFLFAWIGLSDKHVLDESICAKKTYSLLIPQARLPQQTVCRGGQKKAAEDPCTKFKTCSHEECRMHCNSNAACNYYFHSAIGQCRLFKSCSQQKSAKYMGPTYAKVCQDFAGTVGVSWGEFTLERWQRDADAIRAEIEERGGMYMAKNAAGDVSQQISDIEDLVNQDVDALIVLAIDPSQLTAALKKAHDKKIPVIAYDRLIDDESVYYITFDNVEVGRMQARAVIAAQPTGKYVFIKGSEDDPNAHFVRQGQQEMIDELTSPGDITIVDEAFTPGWSPAEAETNFRNIMTAASDDVDAVLASNDGTAGAVAKVLKEKSLTLPLSGQDGDTAALNRVALGEQTVSVWKDARKLGGTAGRLSVSLATNPPGFTMFAELAEAYGCQGFTFTTPSEKEVKAMLLAPVAITIDNLSTVLEAEWITTGDLCVGVTPGSVIGCP